MRLSNLMVRSHEIVLTFECADVVDDTSALALRCRHVAVSCSKTATTNKADLQKDFVTPRCAGGLHRQILRDGLSPELQ